MSFKDQGWEQRFGALGDQAEGIFEQVCADTLKLNFVRCGLNRPPLQMHRLPARVRYWPDYLLSGKFVEVQGHGRDQKLKLKLSKWGALRWWNDVHPVEMFVFDSHNKRWCFTTLDQLEALLCTEHAKLGVFNEGNVYFEFASNPIFEASECVGSVE